MKEEEYKLIPMSEITDEAREIAVAWMECDDKDWIGEKHKLASDIMNYAKKYNTELLRQRDELREALEEQKRLYFNLFDEEMGCMYCEAKLKRGSAIILCKECAENTEV